MFIIDSCCFSTLIMIEPSQQRNWWRNEEELYKIGTDQASPTNLNNSFV